MGACGGWGIVGRRACFVLVLGMIRLCSLFKLQNGLIVLLLNFLLNETYGHRTQINNEI